jgi:hypothetical protein
MRQDETSGKHLGTWKKDGKKWLHVEPFAI